MLDARLLIIAAAFAVAVLAAVVALMSRRRRDGRMLAQPQELPPMKSSLDAAPPRIGLALGRELLPLLEEGRTREAVALVRERTGCGAEEAAASVAKLESLCKRLGM